MFLRVFPLENGLRRRSGEFTKREICSQRASRPRPRIEGCFTEYEDDRFGKLFLQGWG